MQTVYRACAKIDFDDGCAREHWGPCRDSAVAAQNDANSMLAHFNKCERNCFVPMPLSITNWIQTIDSQAEVEMNLRNFNVGYEWPISG